MHDLVVRSVPGDQIARHAALQYACLAGIHHVTVTDPDDVAVGDYDRYTNRWRYSRHLIPAEVHP